MNIYIHIDSQYVMLTQMLCLILKMIFFTYLLIVRRTGYRPIKRTIPKAIIIIIEGK